MVGTRKKEEEPPQEVKSHLSLAEHRLLYKLARSVSHEHVIVEIADKTSKVFETLVSGYDTDGARVYSLALYGKSDSAKKTANVESSRRDSENKGGVSILDESVYDLTRRWKETVGLLVVIGYQHSEEVREAIVCWQGCLSPGAIIVVHNCHEPGPAKAIKEFLDDGGNFVIRRAVDNMAALVVDKCRHYWTINSNEIGVCRNCGRKRNFRRLAREATSLGVKKRTMYRMTR